MEIEISLRSNEIDPDRLHASTLELKRSLLDDTEAIVSAPPTYSTTGAKGDPISVGTIIVTFLTSGTAISLFKVLEAYVTRKRSIDLEVSRPDGAKFVLRRKDLSAKDLAGTQKVFENFIK